jgi:hypothetical protein
MDIAPHDRSPTHPLLHALVRFESVAALYPSNHTRAVEAGEELLGALRACGDAHGTVQIVNLHGRLSVQSTEIPDTSAAARRLREEFDALGVVALEIAGETTLEDLHAFARAWRSTVQSVANTRGLRTAELESLPATIRAHYREFGQRVSVDATTAVETVETVEVAVPCGAARENCQRMVDKTLRRVAARMHSADAPAALQTSAPAARPLDDVLQIAAQVLQHAIERYLSESTEVGGLRKLFDSVELATALSPDAESAQLMLDVLRQSADEVLEAEAAEAEQVIEQIGPDREHYEQTIEALRGELAAQLCGPALEGLELDDRRECLSILFELGGGTRVAGSKKVLTDRLRKLLSEPLAGGERETVQAAIKELCARANAQTFDAILPEIAAALGESQSPVWLAALIEAAVALDVEHLEVLWPHLANQVLLGPRTRTSPYFAATIEQVARLPRAKMSGPIRRLQHLEALFDNKVARHAFAPPRAELAHFYVALLGTTHAQLVGAQLHAQLRTHADKWPGARALACMRSADRECCELMARMLGAQSKTERLQVELAAARTLASKLESLPRESRNEAWIAPTLDWLGQFDSSEIAALLGRIVGERRMLLVAQWPNPCREAAARALARVRARNGEF